MTTAHSAQLKHLIKRNQATFFKQYPSLETWFKTHQISLTEFAVKHATPTLSVGLNSVQDQVADLLSQARAARELLLTITQEEHEAVFEKLRRLLTHQRGGTQEEDLLYLEQQLGDVTGLSLSRTLENISLPHVLGKIQASSHLPLHPNDDQHHLQSIPEAGLSKKRSFFDWFLEQGQLTSEMESVEKYYVGIQLFSIANWQTENKQLKEWFAHRKVLLVNPFDYRAVICSIGNIHTSDRYNYQFSGSPEAIRSSQAWSPKAQGRIALFFVSPHSSKVSNGPLNLEYS